jgi:hypothetical protein
VFTNATIPRFIPEDEATPDEIEAITQGRAEYERGEIVRLEDIAFK